MTESHFRTELDALKTILRRIELYVQKKLTLQVLITDLEALGIHLKHTSAHLKREIRNHWEALEETNALQLAEEPMIADDTATAFINKRLCALKSTVEKAIIAIEP